jgi:hypothetical protein
LDATGLGITVTVTGTGRNEGILEVQPAREEEIKGKSQLL